VLLSPHDPQEAEQCDRLAILDAGKIIATGTPAELKESIGGDVVTIDADRPDEILDTLRGMGLEPSSLDGRIVITTPRGHELIPRLVEAFPRGRLHAVGLRPPNLADVFVRLTGRALRGAA
jgi:ABC-2 type transport system ATP-binding protein